MSLGLLLFAWVAASIPVGVLIGRAMTTDRRSRMQPLPVRSSDNVVVLRPAAEPAARDEVARSAAAGGQAQVVAITQAAEELLLPEPVDLAFCRFVLMHVHEPVAVLKRMGAAVRPNGWVVAQEPVTSAGRVGGQPLSMPDARHPDVGALLPALVAQAGLDVVDAWAESQAGA